MKASNVMEAWEWYQKKMLVSWYISIKILVEFYLQKYHYIPVVNITNTILMFLKPVTSYKVENTVRGLKKSAAAADSITKENLILEIVEDPLAKVTNNIFEIARKGLKCHINCYAWNFKY